MSQALATLFPEDPPRFMARVPHGYHDLAVMAADLARGGFTRSPSFTRLAVRSRATSPGIPAIAYCQATPLRNELEARGRSCLNDATAAATAAIAKRFGGDLVDGRSRRTLSSSSGNVDFSARCPHQNRKLPTTNATERRMILADQHRSLASKIADKKQRPLTTHCQLMWT